MFRTCSKTTYSVVKNPMICFEKNSKITAIIPFIRNENKMALLSCFLTISNLLAPNKYPTTILHDLEKP